MDSNADNSIDVTLSAIDGGYLVLESTGGDKTRFQWPLDKIPRPLEIGSRLSLELQKKQTPSFPSTEKSFKMTSQIRKKEPGKEEDMRKLLEDLVN